MKGQARSVGSQLEALWRARVGGVGQVGGNDVACRVEQRIKSPSNSEIVVRDNGDDVDEEPLDYLNPFT